MSSSLATFLFEAANFLLLAACLGWFFLRPVRDAIEQRRAKLEAERDEIAGQQQSARAEGERLIERRREFEASLVPLGNRAREEAEREAVRILEKAREDAQYESERLKLALAALRREHATSLAGDAAAAARDLLCRLLERIEGPELDRALAQCACRELEALGEGEELLPVIVESPAELDSSVRDSIVRALGAPEEDIQFRVAPELVAGLRIVTRRGLVDVSAAGMSARVAQQLLHAIETEEGSGG